MKDACGVGARTANEFLFSSIAVSVTTEQGGFGTEGVELARVPLDSDTVLINRRRRLGVAREVAGRMPAAPRFTDPGIRWTSLLRRRKNFPKCNAREMRAQSARLLSNRLRALRTTNEGHRREMRLGNPQEGTARPQAVTDAYACVRPRVCGELRSNRPTETISENSRGIWCGRVVGIRTARGHQDKACSLRHYFAFYCTLPARSVAKG